MSELNKMVGYALLGLSTNAGRLVDQRINLDSPLLTGAATVAGFLGSLTGMDALMHRGLDLAPDEPCRAVVHDGVGGIPGVLVIRPPTLPSWHRVGDVMDLAGELGAAPQARLEFLPGALWPYTSQFMDADTGVDLDPRVAAWSHASHDDLAGLDAAGRDAFALATTGFPTFNEASRRVVPAVPSAIRALVTWGGLFTSPGLLTQLRPALYSWWA